MYLVGSWMGVRLESHKKINISHFMQAQYQTKRKLNLKGTPWILE